MRTIKGKITWIDIQNPTREDLEFIKKLHKFHPVILDELLHASARAHVEPYDKYLFMTYHMPSYDKKIGSSKQAEIDFLITKDKVITVHYEDLEPLDNFFKRLNEDFNFKDKVLNYNSGKTIYYIIEEMLNFSQRQIRHMGEDLSNLNKELFKKKEVKLLETISHVKRGILDYGLISKPQAIVLESLRAVGDEFWKDHLKVYLSDLVGDHLKIMQLLDNYKETIESIEETNSQLLNAKTNSIMQKFTVLAFFTFPLMLITAIFSVSAVDNAVGNNPVIFGISFLIVLGITLTIILKEKGKLL